MNDTGMFADGAHGAGYAGRTAAKPAGRACPWPTPGPSCTQNGVVVFTLDLHREAGAPASVEIGPDEVLLAAPLTGSALHVSNAEISCVVPQGHAVVISREGEVELGQADAGMVGIVRLDRARLQAWVGATYQEPRRLGRKTILIESADGVLDRFFGEAARVTDFAAGDEGHLDEHYRYLIAQIDRCGVAGGAWQPIRALKRATDYIFANLTGDCSADAVADAAGMTVKTLQRQMRAYLGSSLSVFVRDARLTAARLCLESAWESRPIEIMAIECGFTSATVFSRAYRRRFGEAPSAARARAVRAAA